MPRCRPPQPIPESWNPIACAVSATSTAPYMSRTQQSKQAEWHTSPRTPSLLNGICGPSGSTILDQR